MSNGVRFDAATHTYWDGPRRVNNVTTILSVSGLVDTTFMSGRGPYYLDRGTCVHSFTARRDTGERTDLRTVRKAWRGCVSAWEDFKAETKLQILDVEKLVYNGEWAGQLDRVVLFPHDALRTILDLKCGGVGAYPGDWVKYQTVAYGAAYELGRLFNRMAVTLRENGSYKAARWSPDTWLADLNTFRQAAKDTANSRAFSGMLQQMRGNR